MCLFLRFNLPLCAMMNFYMWTSLCKYHPDQQINYFQHPCKILTVSPNVTTNYDRKFCCVWPSYSHKLTIQLVFFATAFFFCLFNILSDIYMFLDEAVVHSLNFWIHNLSTLLLMDIWVGSSFYLIWINLSTHFGVHLLGNTTKCLFAYTPRDGKVRS